MSTNQPDLTEVLHVLSMVCKGETITCVNGNVSFFCW